MRKHETDQIRAIFTDQGIELTVLHASERYFEALHGITDPEQKRKIIGEVFIRLFEGEQERIGAKYLVQGTIAPDWIESEVVFVTPSRAITMSVASPRT